MLKKTKVNLKEFKEVMFWKVKQVIFFARALLKKQWLRNIYYVGISGSAGKTTTKDLAASVLATSGPTQSTLRSRNRFSNVAEHILQLSRNDRYCVLEMGVSKPGSMDWPLRLVRPDIAALTVIDRDHFRAFKSIDAIAAEKAKLILSLSPQGTAVLNMDDERIRAIGARCQCKIIWVGASEGATIRVRDVTSSWPDPLRLTVEHDGQTYDVQTQLHGKHLAVSILCALGIGLAAGIPLKTAIDALAQVKAQEGRMQIVHGQDGVIFVRDDWKAPLWSAEFSLEFLREAKAKRKVAIIGTLSDISGDASKKYKAFGRRINNYADLAVFVGPNAHRAARGKQPGSNGNASIISFPTVREAVSFLQTELREGDLVLLKGSNTADHLVRLMLTRYQEVGCWLERCGRNIFCTACPQMEKLTEQSPIAIPRSGRVQKNAALHDDKIPFSESSSSTVTVVVGLGNPGEKYQHTVHNLGYRLVDRIAELQGGSWQKTDDGLVCLLPQENDNDLLLFKPASKMNLIGPILRRFLISNNSNPEHCIVVHDDLDLPFGKIRIKHDGGHSGHNGVRSVITAMETDTFRRVRIGARESGDDMKAAAHVLTEFTLAEEKQLGQILDLALERLEECLREGMQPVG